jgi:hypothetical protein
MGSVMNDIEGCIKFQEDMYLNTDIDADQEIFAQLHKDSATYLKQLKKILATNAEECMKENKINLSKAELKLVKKAQLIKPSLTSVATSANEQKWISVEEKYTLMLAKKWLDFLWKIAVNKANNHKALQEEEIDNIKFTKDKINGLLSQSK